MLSLRPPHAMVAVTSFVVAVGATALTDARRSLPPALSDAQLRVSIGSDPTMTVVPMQDCSDAEAMQFPGDVGCFGCTDANVNQGTTCDCCQNNLFNFEAMPQSYTPPGIDMEHPYAADCGVVFIGRCGPDNNNEPACMNQLQGLTNCPSATEYHNQQG